MDFNYRVKAIGYTTDQLLAMGFGVNTYECQPGEHWAIACSGSAMDRLIKRHKLNIVGQPEAIRG
jgi:hypothetical protein